MRKEEEAKQLSSIVLWEHKKDTYVKLVHPILKKWALQFDKLFSGYIEDIKLAVVQSQLSDAVPQMIVAYEFERFENTKKQLFMQNNLVAGIKVIDNELLDRRNALVLQKNIVLLQSVARRWLARNRFRELQKKSRQRKKIICEILDTERVYVKNIGILVNVFLNPLRVLSRGSEPLLTLDEISKIFSNCELIFNVHQELLSTLETRFKNAASLISHAVLTREQMINNKSEDISIGDIFERLSPFLKLYTQYVSNYNIALTTLAEAKKRDDAVSEFFKDCHANPEVNRKDFSDFQIIPVQRIPRYVLLLKELLKYTEKDHPDYKHLTQALSKMQEVAANINESKRHAESLEKLLIVQSYFLGKCEDIVQPHRKFVKEGVLYFFNQKKKPSTKGRKPYRSWSGMMVNQDEHYVFLMNDLVIVSRRKTSLLDPSQQRFSYVITIQLHYATLEPLNDTAVIQNGFALISSHVVYNFWCTSIKERDEWIKVFG